MTIVEELERAGLTGRGGAAFSTAIKVRAAHDNDADLVVNACDGEVGARKDAWVVEHHLAELVEGARLVASGRRDRVTYAAHRGSRTADLLTRAGLEVLDVPARYVSSEETAILSLLHGGLAKPMTKRLPFVYGGRDSLGKRIAPTVVLNAETVWRVSQVRRNGPDWFRRFGTDTEPGPRLVSVGGAVAHPGIFEVGSGVPIRDLLDAAGGLEPRVPALLVGGLGGVLLTTDEAATTAWSGPGMAAYGGSMGAGVIEALDPTRCPLDVVTDLVTYGAGESAGQCGPCMFGLPAVAESWAELARDPNQQTLDRLQDRLGVIPGRGACHHPDGVTRFVGSALRVLMPHIHEHVAGPCPLGRSRHAVH